MLSVASSLFAAVSAAPLRLPGLVAVDNSPLNGTVMTDLFPIAPAVILALCVVAGIGTMLMLPGRRDATFRKIGGVIVIATVAIFAAILVRTFGGNADDQMGVYFWIFAAIALFGALRVITHTRPIYSALYFVLTVFATAGLFLLLYAEFMAVALVLIYAGAILVTYVFVIMLASEAASTGAEDKAGKLPLMGLAEHDAIAREPIAASAVGFALMGMLLFVVFDKATVNVLPVGSRDTSLVSGATQALGEYLFKNQVVNLELAGLILTVAMVGAIVIARKKVIVIGATGAVEPETVVGPSTPIDDNPHSIRVYGTDNPRQKAFPET